jgi:hypothetical protein
LHPLLLHVGEVFSKGEPPRADLKLREMGPQLLKDRGVEAV